MVMTDIKSKPVPKWILMRYAKLWRIFGTNYFNKKDAVEALTENNIHLSKRKALISVVLSDLKKAGWLTMMIDPVDGRCNISRLRDPVDIILNMEVE